MPPLFLGVYATCLYNLLAHPRRSGPGLVSLLVVGGMPPGAVFIVKVLVVRGLWGLGVWWVWIVVLALSEIVSWGVYLSLAMSR